LINISSHLTSCGGALINQQFCSTLHLGPVRLGKFDWDAADQ
jgi:hypothetical protein